MTEKEVVVNIKVKIKRVEDHMHLKFICIKLWIDLVMTQLDAIII